MDELMFIGNLGGDPVMRYTSGKGTAVCDFSVGCSRSYTDDKGNKVSEPKWYKVIAWGNLAEACNNYLKKGSKVFVRGRLMADKQGNCPTFTRQDGSAGAKFEVTAEVVEFLTGREGSGSDAKSADSLSGEKKDTISF